ncbi:MAG TPA: hypothetical protein VJ908_10950 [Wenzhouxiangellaceae bacterium]|nr:hypothetical protein [Wenzhouxiangellaceae bacterium]
MNSTLRFMHAMAVLAIVCFSPSSQAQQDERAPGASASGPATQVRGIGGSAGPGDLVIGTGAFDGVAANSAYSVDTVSANSMPIFDAPVGGMTVDVANSRVLFTTSTADTADVDWSTLMAWPLAGGTPTVVGTITVTGIGPIRIDGLAFSGGTLYGYLQFDTAGNTAGLYSIDPGTLEATPVAADQSTNGISGLGAHPVTGQLYVANDTANELQALALDGSLTTVAAYPAGLVDIDGLTIGNGAAFLVTDEAGDIQVYDFGGGTFSTLASPFTTEDTFSGAGLVPPQALPEARPVPAIGTLAWILMMMLVSGLGIAWLQRSPD